MTSRQRKVAAQRLQQERERQLLEREQAQKKKEAQQEKLWRASLLRPVGPGELHVIIAGPGAAGGPRGGAGLLRHNNFDQLDPEDLEALHPR